MNHSASLSSERIVVGVDATPAAGAALRWAMREAAWRDAQVVAVSAWEVPDARFNLFRSPAYDQLRSEVAAECTQGLERAIRWATELEVGYPVGSVVKNVQEGLAAEVLCKVSHGATLLVVGARARRSWQRALLGSTSAAVLQHATCPIVVLRAVDGQGSLAQDAEIKALVDGWK